MNQESGRSMIEMLGVLAIMGVITVGAIGMISTAMRTQKLTAVNDEVVQMVKKLHEKYPNAYMIWTHTVSNAGKYAIQAMTDAGIMKAGYMKEVIIPKVGADDTVGANSHNSIATHIATAEIIADALSEHWGFMRLNPNIVMSDYDAFITKF